MTIRDILVIDDSKTELLFLSRLLSEHGMSVRCAENASQALQQLAQAKPDLILMDIVMPGQNGFHLTRQIHRTPAYAAIPIIICSSKNQESDRVWGLRQGAREYITKPVDIQELMDKIKLVATTPDASQEHELKPAPSHEPQAES